MNHWLLKTEPDVFSFDHLKKRPKKTEPWNGVRNDDLMWVGARNRISSHKVRRFGMRQAPG